MPDSDRDLLIRIDERTKQTALEVEAIHGTLHGNGSDGLKVTVARQDERLEDLEHKSGRNKKIDTVGATAFLGSFAAWLYQMVSHIGTSNG